MAFNAKNKDKITAVKGLDSSAVYTEQDQKKRLEAAAEAGRKARQAAVEKLKKQNRESREANDKARKQAVAQSNANRAKTASIEERVDQKRQITDAMTKTREWGAGKGDKWQSQGDFQTAYNAYENAVNWAEQAEAAGDAATAKYMREAASYLAKWGNAAGAELTKITNQYGSFDNAVDYRSGDKSGYREYLNRDKTWDEINRHITELKRTIDTTSDLKRRAEYMDELAWYEDYARNNYTEAAQGELEQLQRMQNTLQSALAQADINNSPLTGTPVGDRQRAETLRRFDEDIAAAKAGNMDAWYISALEKAREQFLADEAPVSYEQNWQDIDRYDELSRRVEGMNAQIADAEKTLKKAKDSEYERENRIKYAALEQEMNAADWYFDQYDYEDFKQLVAREKNSAATMGMPDIYTVDVRDQYTKDEASIYMYLREKGRAAEADAYANYMQSAAAARRNQQIGQRLAAEDIGIIGRTIGSVAANPGKIANTIDINLQKLANALSDDYVPIDYETTANFGVASNVNRELATQELNALGTLNDLIGRDIPYIGSYTLGDLYGTGVDYLNSAMNAVLFGTSGAGAALGAEKFSDEYRAAKERGASDDEAFKYAWGSAIAEGVGEQIVLDRYLGFLTKLGKRPGKAAAVIAGLFSVAEGGVQEAATTVMENAIDKWTMGDNNEYSRAVKRYEAMGYERGTAEQMAIDDMNREILKSGIMGAIGQGAPVAIGGAAYGISDAVEDAGTTRALGKDIIGQGNAAGMAQLIGEVSGKQTKARTSAGAVGRQYTKFAQNVQKYVETADESVRGVIKEKADRVMMAPVMALDGTSQATKEKASKRTAAMRKSDEGASVGGESVTVQGFVKTASKIGDARLNIKKADGTLAEANMEDVTFDTRTAEVYSYAADMATPELANMFRLSVQPDQMAGIERVANGYSQAYDMAKAGFREASVRASSLTDALTDEQVSAAYKLGADARSAGQMQAITAARQRAETNLGNRWKGGKATFDSSVVVDALDDEQKNQIDMASAITGAMGVNVVFFESKADEMGRYTRENGSYNRKTNTIYIDVNAGRNYKGDSMTKTALLRTLSHEVTHAIQRNSPESYAELRDMVVDILGDTKGATIEDLIDRKMAQDGSLTTRDAAIDELVADACEKMLEDSDAAQRLMEAHPEAAKTFFRKVGELLNRIAEAIRAAFKGRQLSTEAQLVMKDVERYQKMVDLWTKGVMQTAEVSGRELGETTDSEMENAAISEETAAEGEDVTSEELVGEYGEPARRAETHIDNRTWENVGDRGVKAFQNEYKYARMYMGPAAKALLADANASLPGERYRTADGEWGGQQRQTTEVLAELKDRGGWSWEQLKAALGVMADRYDVGDLEREIPDTAIIKRIEIVLDEILTEGYDAMEGARIVPDAGYVAYKNKLPGAAEYSNIVQDEGVTFEDYTQFQARNSVERARGLVAVHNLTEEKLAAAIKLGGFPMPSIAIAKTSIGHQNFGPISLVFGRETIDPKANRKNKVYSADAWTPTFPRIEYEADEKAERRIHDKLTGLKARIDTYFASDLQKLLYDADDQLNRHDGEEGLIKNALNNYGLKAAYLEDTGRHADVVTKTEERARKVNPLQADIYKAIADLVGLEGLKSRPLSEIRDMYGAQLEGIYPGSTKSAIRMARILGNVADYFENQNAEPEIVTVTDAEATHRAIDEAIDDAEYERWVRKLYAGIEGNSGVYNGKDLYTSSGNRRSFASTHYPVSVENIAKAMYDAYGGKMKNVSAHYDAKTMRAVTARSFKSVDEMHKYEGRMRARTQEEADALTNDLNSRLNALVNRIQADRNAGREVSLYDQMTQADQIGAILQEIAVKKFDPASIQSGLAAYGYQIGEQTAAELSAVIQDISEMPVNIFEAKPERAVYFDEVQYAIVPDDMSADVRRQLEQLVPDVREYTEGDEARRLELLNEREDVQFQTREVDGQKIVWIEENILKLKPKDMKYTEYIAEYLKKHIGEVYRIIESGQKVYLGADLPGEYTDSRYTKRIRNKGHETFDAKNRLAAGIGEAIEIATNRRWEKTKHPDNKDATFGMYRYSASIAFPQYDSGGKITQVHAYTADLLIRNAANGRKYLYDVVNIKNDTIKAGSLLKRETARRAFEAAKLKGVISDNSIRDREQNVNLDIQKQTREEAISTRYALANMLETDAVSGEEVAWLRGYKNQFEKLEQLLGAIDQNKKIIRELMFKKGRTEAESIELQKARDRNKILQDKVASIDEGLLKLEKADVIRSLVAREEQKIRDKEAEKRREGIAKVRENQRNTAIRKNIQRRAKRLDRMLRQPSDKEHIPEGLRGAMLDMMEIFTGSEAAFGGAKADRERLYRAQREYEAMRGDEDNADLASRYDEDTADRLRQLADLMKDRKISDFNNAELTQLSMVIEHFEHLVRDQNEAFADSRRKKTEGYAEQIWQQTMTMKGRKENAITGSALVKALKHLGYANLTPPYFFKHLGGAMGKLGNDLLKAEGRWGVNMKKAVNRIAEIQDKYERDKWATKKGDILKIETEIGDTLELTREQALGIWASAKRERLNTTQRAAHLRDGGVMLEKTARKLGMKGQEINVTPTKISQRDIQQIDKWLTDQQKAYADEMVGYMSREMAALGNETSMELVGYKKFGEGYYYPYKTSSDFRRTELGKVENALIKNMGFTKSVERGAKTPVVITDFSATVADHVNAMIMYNAFAVAQDQMMRVYDFKLDDSNSVKNLLRKAFGDEIPAYIEQLMRDLYGGVSPDRDAGIINRLISAHKKQAVLGSASVVVQQPTALIRAMSQINPKYFVGQRVEGGFDEAMDYAGTAVIKDIGGFDSGVGRGATDWLNGNPKDWQNHAIKSGLDTVSDWAGLGAEYADKLAWTAIWKAVKREQADKYKADINSQELKEIAGERFNEVVRLTQVYDSVMTRSQLMRNKNLFWKMATSFMSEATVTWNMMYDAGIEAFKNKKIGKAGGIIASVLVSTILTNLAKAVVTAARDDDDEEATYLERYAKNAAEGLINDAVPFNYMPIVRDIYSKLQGYEVERADMGIINDMLAAGEVMLDEDKAPIAKVKSLITLVSIMTGLPAKNIWRDVEAAFNTAVATPQSEARPGWLENALRTGAIDATPIGKWFDLTDSKANNADRLYEAILDGDMAGAEELREHLIAFNGVADDDAVDSLMRNRIKEGFIAGEIDEAEALEMLTEHGGKRRNEAEDLISEWSYTRDNDGRKYDDMKDAFLAGEISAEEAIDARVKYGGAEEENSERTVQTWQYQRDTGYVYDDMRDDVLDGEISAADAIAYRVKYGGVKQETAEATVGKWEYERKYGYAYEDLREEHAAGNITSSEAIRAMTEYGGKDANDAYWEVTEWDYTNDGGEWDGKGTLLNDAFAGGNAAKVRSSMKQLLEHSNWKKPGNELASYVTNYYKPLFETATADRKRQLQPVILDYIQMAYEAAGEEYFGDDYTLRYRSWLKIK